MESVSINSRIIICDSLLTSTPLNPVQRKRTAHERAKDLFASGEFSSGRKWADDAPKEKLDTNTVNLIASGACGAFVHGLEDEMFGKITCGT